MSLAEYKLRLEELEDIEERVRMEKEIRRRELRIAEISRTIGSKVKFIPKEHCKGLIEHMREGRSFSTYAGVVGVGYDTLARWRKKYVAFREAYEIGLSLQMLSWEDLLIDISRGGEASGTQLKAITFALQNYFPDEYAKLSNNGNNQIANNTQIIIETGVVKLPDAPKSKELDGDVEVEYNISKSMEKVIQGV